MLILLKPTLLISNSTLFFEENDDIIIEKNASDIIYFIIEAVELLTSNSNNDIKISFKKEDDFIKISIQAQNIENIDFSNLKLLVDDDKIEINNNIVVKF